MEIQFVTTHIPVALMTDKFLAALNLGRPHISRCWCAYLGLHGTGSVHLDDMFDTLPTGRLCAAQPKRHGHQLLRCGCRELGPASPAKLPVEPIPPDPNELSRAPVAGDATRPQARHAVLTASDHPSSAYPALARRTRTRPFDFEFERQREAL